MAKSILTQKHFHSEAAAYAFVEARVWANGVTCPHCGNVDEKKIGKLAGNSTRIGVRKCYACRKPFTVKVGTIFESSHIALHLWLQAIFLMASSKKGISTQQLHRTLGVTLKSAWFLSHRIREAMREGNLAPMGGAGGIIEVDETYIGKEDRVSAAEIKADPQGTRPFKNVVLTLVERGGSARSFHIDHANIANILPILRANLHREVSLMTDSARVYSTIGREFASHDAVDHNAFEWTRGHIGTNTVEGFYSIFKRGRRASISTAQRSTCTATSRSSISAIATV